MMEEDAKELSKDPDYESAYSASLEDWKAKLETLQEAAR